jgi:hypothetical protein
VDDTDDVMVVDVVTLTDEVALGSALLDDEIDGDNEDVREDVTVDDVDLDIVDVAVPVGDTVLPAVTVDARLRLGDADVDGDLDEGGETLDERDDDGEPVIDADPEEDTDCVGVGRDVAEVDLLVLDLVDTVDVALLLAADEDDRLRLGEDDADGDLVEVGERLDERDVDGELDTDFVSTTHVELVSSQTPLTHSSSLTQEPSAFTFCVISRRNARKSADAADDGDGDGASSFANE